MPTTKTSTISFVMESLNSLHCHSTRHKVSEYWQVFRFPHSIHHRLLSIAFHIQNTKHQVEDYQDHLPTKNLWGFHREVTQQRDCRRR